MFKPAALELIKKKRANFDQIAEFCESPKAFLRHLDAAGIHRAVLINYVAPEVIGFTSGVNQYIADYTKECPGRLISCGGLHPRHTSNILVHRDTERRRRRRDGRFDGGLPHRLRKPARFPRTGRARRSSNVR